MSSKKHQIPAIRFKGFTDAWEQRKLGDIADIKDSARISNELWVENGIPYLRSSDLVNGELNGELFISKETYEGYASKTGAPQKDDVLFTSGGKVGVVYHKKDESPVYVQGGAVLYVKTSTSNLLDGSFLSIYFGSPRMQTYMDIASSGGTIKHFTLKPANASPIIFPGLSEQQKIGAFFKELDKTIALHQRKLEKTKALKSAYLSELFPVEGERKPKRRFAGFIDDWKQGTVGEYGYFYYGKSAPKWSVTKDAIIPCVRYGELYTKFGAKIDKVYSYTNISKENLKFSTGNEVLVPRVGEDPLDFANCSWLSIPNVAIGEMISVYNTEENPLFISYYFNSQLRHAFAKRVEGGNVSNLYFTYLENITISIPNKEEQDTIANFLESLDSVVEHHQHKLEKLKNIKQAYLNELFV